MLTNPYECCCEPYERVANETTTRHMRSLFAYTHCRVYIFVFYLLDSAQSAYSPSYLYLLSASFHYTTRISIRMQANLYKRLTITTIALSLIRMACELLPNMLRICVFTNFRNMFLKFAKPLEQPRIYTNTN